MEGKSGGSANALIFTLASVCRRFLSAISRHDWIPTTIVIDFLNRWIFLFLFRVAQKFLFRLTVVNIGHDNVSMASLKVSIFDLRRSVSSIDFKSQYILFSSKNLKWPTSKNNVIYQLISQEQVIHQPRPQKFIWHSESLWNEYVRRSKWERQMIWQRLHLAAEMRDWDEQTTIICIFTWVGHEREETQSFPNSFVNLRLAARKEWEEDGEDRQPSLYGRAEADR